MTNVIDAYLKLRHRLIIVVAGKPHPQSSHSVIANELAYEDLKLQKIKLVKDEPYPNDKIIEYSKKGLVIETDHYVSHLKADIVLFIDTKSELLQAREKCEDCNLKVDTKEFESIGPMRFFNDRSQNMMKQPIEDNMFYDKIWTKLFDVLELQLKQILSRPKSHR